MVGFKFKPAIVEGVVEPTQRILVESLLLYISARIELKCRHVFQNRIKPRQNLAKLVKDTLAIKAGEEKLSLHIVFLALLVFQLLE